MTQDHQRCASYVFKSSGLNFARRALFTYFQTSRLWMYEIFSWHTKHSNSSPLQHSLGIGGTRCWPNLEASVARDDRTELKDSCRRSRALGLMYSSGSVSRSFSSILLKMEGAEKVVLVGSGSQTGLSILSGFVRLAIVRLNFDFISGPETS